MPRSTDGQRRPRSSRFRSTPRILGILKAGGAYVSLDPAHPAEALPTGIVAKRIAQRPNPVAMLMGFGIGLAVWFKATLFIPLLQNLATWARWLLSALPLLTLPWWMDAFPQALSHFSRDVGSIVADMFADVDKTDRLVASDPSQAMLATGDRLVWRLSDSVYADTFGRFMFVPPKRPPASERAALAALTDTLTAQVSSLDDAERAQLFGNLGRDMEMELKEVGEVFKPAATEVEADPAASTATRRAAKHFLVLQ